MGAKLVAYGCVPPGFEMVIDKNQARAWNLWWNTRLTDDPDAWDDEVRRINAMQSALGELTEDERLVRAHVAEFCRYSPAFPRSVEVLCAEIGGRRLREPASVGCEGRGLLDALVERRSDDSWRESGTRYAAALRKWLDGGRAETVLEAKAFGLLGGRTDAKDELVRRIAASMEGDGPSVRSIARLSREVCAETFGTSGVPKGRPFNCFGCPAGRAEGDAAPECRCCAGMYADALLLCAGSSGEAAPRVGEFARFVEEGVLVYACALDSWLRGRTADALAARDLRYFGGDLTAKAAREAHASLGARDGTKEWLAACLLKTLTDNQRWHEGKELIDGHPEARSWLRGGMAPRSMYAEG